MYAFTQLRDQIRSGNLKASSSSVNLTRLLELPLPIRDAVTAIEENAEALLEKVGDENTGMIRSCLRGLSETQHVDEESVQIESSSSSTLIAYGDGNHEKELVYGVGIDSAKKRITVAFRGSVTQKDFRTDACIGMVAFQNPVYGTGEDPDQRKSVKIHSGFHEYLLKKSNETGMSKFDEIIAHVLPLFKDRPGYRLYTTGHSLGGALSTLFAFEVAANFISSALPIPTPVTCVSIASPKPGNESFRRAFQSLEKRGLLRHLRIANEGDPVTMGPPVSSKVMLLSLSPALMIATSILSPEIEDEVYKHVGIKLKLKISSRNKNEQVEGNTAGVLSASTRDPGTSKEKDQDSVSSRFVSLFTTNKTSTNMKNEGNERSNDTNKDKYQSSFSLKFDSLFSTDDTSTNRKDAGSEMSVGKEDTNKDNDQISLISADKISTNKKDEGSERSRDTIKDKDQSNLSSKFGSFFSTDFSTNKNEKVSKQITEKGLLPLSGGHLSGLRYKISDSTGSWKKDFLNPTAATVSYHYTDEYSVRLMSSRDDLGGILLNNLYRMRENLS